MRRVLSTSLALWGCGFNPFDAEAPVDEAQGCLRPWPEVALGWYPVSLDVDGDGRLDVATLVEDGIAWGMNLDRARPFVQVTALENVAALRAGDLDGDGRGDLVSRDIFGELYLQSGTHHGLAAPVALGVAWAADEYELGDFDGDGRQDLVEAASLVRYRLQLDDGSFADPVEVQSQAGDLAVGDFDEDGDDEVLVARGNHVSILWGDPHAPLAARDDLLYPGASVNLLEVLDLDADGHLDLVQSTLYSGRAYQRVFVYGDGMGGFSERIEPRVPEYGSFVLADLDGDGVLDSVPDEDPGSVRFGEPAEDGRLTFGDAVFFDPGLSLIGGIEPAPDPRSHRFEDWTGDGKADLAGVFGFAVPEDEEIFDPSQAEPFSFLASCTDGDEHPPNGFNAGQAQVR